MLLSGDHLSFEGNTPFRDNKNVQSGGAIIFFIQHLLHHNTSFRVESGSLIPRLLQEPGNKAKRVVEQLLL